MSLPDHFALFGLPERFALDLAELERIFLSLSRQLHPDRHATAAPAERLAAVQKSTDLNQAYKVLRDDFARAEHLLRRRGIDTAETTSQDNRATVDSTLLMEVMELREALAEARGSGDRAVIAKLTADVEARQAQAWERIRAGFTAVDAGEHSQLRTIAKDMVSLRYYRRFLEEARDIEEHA